MNLQGGGVETQLQGLRPDPTDLARELSVDTRKMIVETKKLIPMSESDKLGEQPPLVESFEILQDWIIALIESKINRIGPDKEKLGKQRSMMMLRVLR